MTRLEEIQQLTEIVGAMENTGFRVIHISDDTMTKRKGYSYIYADGIAEMKQFSTERGFGAKELEDIADELTIAWRDIMQPRIDAAIKRIHDLSAPIP